MSVKIDSFHPDVVRYHNHAGCLAPIHIRKIADHPETRLEKLLVRCGNGRFLAPAQDIMHFVNIIVRDGVDHVRDVSIPA